ncbi:hypothetical protein PDE_00065 [Penicillium oxalicum 114-2]|uniref:Amidase domain-containing protein n=1 Tax=Penicillium oxalicum (strain 114-2 / CGMCC 5302) TaxID=933388 RepID=S7Z4U5_PENO1|nr:hypothetical protein PDE_00065 [Penicillium oxalicum 114-2]
MTVGSGPINDGPPFEIDPTSLTISSFHHLLFTGKVTCTALVQAYLDRIARYDPALRSLIYVNPNALEHNRTHSTSPPPPLHGIPIILKDNFTTIDTPTSAGVLALQSLHTTIDAPVVQRLRDAGAIILAKANMHEFALHGTTTSSLGGQTVNPFDYTRTPGGSSGGTAVAIAMGLGLVGCGSDTVNSLRSPASACGIVGFRPSRGRVCTDGVVPVCEVQDAVGPMGRCVRDVRVVFEVMSGGKTGAEEGEEDQEKEKELMPGDLNRNIKALNSLVDGHEPGIDCVPTQVHTRRPVRIGILEAYFGLDDHIEHLELDPLVQENKQVQRVVRNALSLISASAGLEIELISLNPTCHPDWRFATLQSTADTQIFEFQERLDAFLQSPTVISPYRSLSDIAKSGLYDHNAVTDVFTAPLRDPETFCMSSPGFRTCLENIAALKCSVRECFAQYDLDAVVYPHQRQLPVKIGTTIQPRRNGILAALTGRPAICLPAGFSAPSESAPRGVPIGLELMGQDGQDEALLTLAERMECLLSCGKAPAVNIENTGTGPLSCAKFVSSTANENMVR